MKAYTYNDRLVGVGNDQILGTDQGGGSKEYYAGQYISIDENDVISVTGLAPVSAIPDVSDMATKTWVGNQGYLTEVPSTYATDTEVYEAVITGVQVATGVIPDTSDMATKTWVGNQGYLTSVPSNYATDIEVSQAIASSIPAPISGSDGIVVEDSVVSLDNPIGLVAGDNITIEVTGVSAIISAQGGGGTTYTAGQYISIDSNDVISVTGVATTSDISDMATQTWVGNQGYLTSVPEGYTTDQELAEAVTAVTSIIPAAQVNSDWNANSGVAEILNKPTEIQLIAGTNVQIEVSGVSAVISAQGGGVTETQVYNATVTAVQTATGAIPTFTEGNCIDITSNAISWETTAGITDIISVTALPANPVATVIYLIPET